MKWVSQVMHAKEVQEFLRAYDFVAESLQITHLYSRSYEVLVTFLAKEKKTEL